MAGIIDEEVEENLLVLDLIRTDAAGDAFWLFTEVCLQVGVSEHETILTWRARTKVRDSLLRGSIPNSTVRRQKKGRRSDKASPQEEVLNGTTTSYTASDQPSRLWLGSVDHDEVGLGHCPNLADLFETLDLEPSMVQFAVL